jgi:hypothetical protein
MGQTREQKIIKQLSPGQFQRQTPIATDMFLPNHSGIASHPESKRTFVPYTGAVANVDLGTYDLSLGGITITNATSVTYQLTDDGLHLGLLNSVSGQQTQFNMYTADGDGTDGNYMNIFGVGTYNNHGTNYEKVTLSWTASTSQMQLKSLAGGTGTVRPLSIFTGTNTDQLLLNINGTTTIAKGIYNSSDGSAGITTSKSWTDETAGVTHNVTVKNGIITSWNIC